MFYEKKIYKSNELKLLWGSDGNTFKKRLYYQLKTNKFIKIRRGIYVVFDQLYNLKESDYRMIANSIYIPSYVSFETVLRDEGVIFQRYTSIFVACKYTKTITISYNGILPDLFREEQGIVAEGELINSQIFQATRVLAKHDANYMPPEIKAALAKKVNS